MPSRRKTGQISACGKDVADELKPVRTNEPLSGLKPGVSGLWHTCHRSMTVPDYAGMASASLRAAIHPQA